MKNNICEHKPYSIKPTFIRESKKSLATNPKFSFGSTDEIQDFIQNHAPFTENLAIQPLKNLFSSRFTSPSVFETIQYQVLTRIVAISISFFALVDTIANLISTTKKISLLVLHNLDIFSLKLPPSTKDIFENLTRLGTLLKIVLIGSILGVVYPRIYSSPKKSLTEKNVESVEGSNIILLKKEEPAYEETLELPLPKTWKQSSRKVQLLWKNSSNKSLFAKAWEDTSLEDKRVFVHLLDLDSTPKAVKAKKDLLNVVYKKVNINPYSPNKEITTPWPNQTNEAYYHATKLEGLKGILQSGKVEVRQQKHCKGAFISTRPESAYGNYVIVFKRNIEWFAKVTRAYYNAQSTWAGFEKDLPITPFTVEKILIQNLKKSDAEEEKAKVENLVKTWTKYSIPIEIYDCQKKLLKNQIYPRNWGK